jgi:hypothetical protein
MRLKIYLKHNMGYLTRDVKKEVIKRSVEDITKKGITEHVGSTHTYYPPDMIMYFQW